jgi:glycosyltransferase involved in cell wall biosynthesis
MKMVKLIRAFNPDVVHLQEAHMWFNFVLPLLRKFPLVVTTHDAMLHPGDMDARKTPQWLRDRSPRRASQLIVHAPQIKESLLKRLKLPSSNVHIIPHIMIGEPIKRQALDDEQLILFFGRIWEYKGLEYLIRAEPLVTSRFPQAKIAIAGKGEDFTRYRRMMSNPERFVICNEYISEEKRTELFSRASIVVLPYIEASQSGVIPIAYRFAKPVIATNVGGLPDMVEHGRTGYLVPPRDETALANAIIELLQNKDLRNWMGENGRVKVNTTCSPELVGKLTSSVYRQAISG